VSGRDGGYLLPRETRTWVVTGGAGFIGSHLVEHLLDQGQRVIVLDNYSTGHRRNLEEVAAGCGDSSSLLRVVEADVCDLDACREVCEAADFVLHQAALGSVPRSIKDPLATNQSNVVGFLNMLVAASEAGVKRFVYAASSSTYGDEPSLPKVEHRIGSPLSPYAVSKYVNELYAGVFHRVYGMETVGLRYFNVFGPRQDPNGAYAAVIPRWIGALVSGERCRIHGDGETSRDFSYVANMVQANMLAATAPAAAVEGQVFNVACGERTTLNQLYTLIRGLVAEERAAVARQEPDYDGFREGDVRHSLADITKIQEVLGYRPTHLVDAGLRLTVEWFLRGGARASAVEATA
jgi:UDP-N-acetylglucosamine/UDP-N-acetylgalactosamine 4-epimerase